MFMVAIALVARVRAQFSAEASVIAFLKYRDLAPAFL
jgi:hypothetical protein